MENLDEEATFFLRFLREYVRARRWHPDKTPLRLRAVAEFMEAERAEVLSDTGTGRSNRRNRS